MNENVALKFVLKKIYCIKFGAKTWWIVMRLRFVAGKSTNYRETFSNSSLFAYHFDLYLFFFWLSFLFFQLFLILSNCLNNCYKSIVLSRLLYKVYLKITTRHKWNERLNIKRKKRKDIQIILNYTRRLLKSLIVSLAALRPLLIII